MNADCVKMAVIFLVSLPFAFLLVTYGIYIILDDYLDIYRTEKFVDDWEARCLNE